MPSGELGLMTSVFLKCRNIQFSFTSVTCLSVCFLPTRELPGRAGADDSGCGAERAWGIYIGLLPDVPHDEQHGGHHQG